MEAIVLAGGLGTRLRSEVRDVPKCMAPVGGRPFLWYLLDYLRRSGGVTRVILSVGYLREVIFEWIDEVREEFPFEVDYAIEETPLGTGGGIRLAMSKVRGSEALILNGDTFFDVDIQAMMEAHRMRPDARLTIALKPMRDFSRYGTVSVSEEDDGTQRIMSFNEKKPCAEGLINGGVYILSNDSALFEGLPERFSFETELMQKSCGYDGCLFGVVQDGYFIDIGIPEDYHRADDELPVLFE